MRLYFEKQLPCDPQQAWLFVADPRRVNLWSSVKVYTELTGDGGLSWGVGALRRLDYSSMREPVFELVSIAHPGRNFVTRLLEPTHGLGATISVEIQPSGKGSLVGWDLQALEHYVPDKHAFLKLQQTFQENVVRSVCSFPVQESELQTQIMNEVDTERGARATALDVLETLCDQQRVRIERMLRVADDKSNLAWLLGRTTERTLGAIHQSELKHPHWIAELLVQIDRMFDTALQEHYSSATTITESHWREVFRAIERNDRSVDDKYVDALNAWLLEDVPRALCVTYLNNYRGTCSFARFRTDYFWFVSALLETAAETKQVFPAKLTGRQAQSPTELRKLLPSGRSWSAAFLSRYPFSQWNHAFDRGMRMVQLVDQQVLPGSVLVPATAMSRALPHSVAN